MSATAASVPKTSERNMSAAVPDVEDVAILHEVVFAFEAQGALRAGRGFRSGGEQRIPVDRLRPDEVLLEVGVDRAGGLLRARVGGHGPGAALVLAHGEEADQPEQLVAAADETDQAALLEAVRGQELL